jgi:ABC-2 type transport system permease protein
VTTLVRAELLKLRTNRLMPAIAAITVVLVGLTVSASILAAGRAQGTFGLDTPEGVRNVLGSAWPAATIVLILGILAMSGEMRHGTITSTFLVTPDRRRVVMAKLATYGIVGLASAAAALAVAFAIALPWLAAKDVDVVMDAGLVTVVVGSLLGAILYGALGVGIGALIRNQAAAVAVALVWSFLVEGMLVSLLPEVGKWLPGGAASALGGAATTGGDLLPVWGGGLLLGCYALAVAAAGSRAVIRNDVT